MFNHVKTKEDKFDISIGGEHVGFVDLPSSLPSGTVIDTMIPALELSELDLREKAIYERHATKYVQPPAYGAGYSFGTSSGGADDAMLMEMNILKQKNEQFLEIIQQQSGRIQELEAKLKERGSVQ